MVCPFCTHPKTEVFNSRRTKRLNQTWRRRRCRACQKQFTTRELIDVEGLLQVKNKVSTTARYSRAALFLSLLRACEHNRSLHSELYWLCETIEQKLLTEGLKTNNQVDTNQILAITLATLKRYNTGAYIQYLAQHAPTIDQRTLARELKKK